jgi:hypothetical protein
MQYLRNNSSFDNSKPTCSLLRCVAHIDADVDASIRRYRARFRKIPTLLKLDPLPPYEVNPRILD